jgi:hypothetical protein
MRSLYIQHLVFLYNKYRERLTMSFEGVYEDGNDARISRWRRRRLNSAAVESAIDAYATRVLALQESSGGICRH